jgi:four helix bundle protein
MKTFRTLELAIEFYEVVENLKVKGHMRDQLIRAASSIALNLSEGNAKSSVKEKKRYYQTAYASLKECEVIFRLIKTKDEKLAGLTNHLGASLYKLMKSQLETIDPEIPF